MLSLRKRNDLEFLARGRSLPSLDIDALIVKRTPINTPCGKQLTPKKVSSIFDIRPINARDFDVSGYVVITSAGGFATALFNYSVPDGYTFIARSVSHAIKPALVGYPVSALTIGSGILTTCTIDKSPVPNFGNMNLGQVVNNESIYFLARSESIVGYALSILEDVAGQFNGLAFWVKLTGTLLLSSDYPIQEQIGS